MRYTNKLNLPIIEDSDNFALAFTQPNEISEKLEENIGTYGETVASLNELQNVVNTTNEKIDDVNEKINSLDTIENYELITGDYELQGNACKLVAFTEKSFNIVCPEPSELVPLRYNGIINLTPMLNKLGVNINNVQILNIEFFTKNISETIVHPICCYIDKNTNQVLVRSKADELPEGQSFSRTITLDYTITMLVKKNTK